MQKKEGKNNISIKQKIKKSKTEKLAIIVFVLFAFTAVFTFVMFMFSDLNKDSGNNINLVKKIDKTKCEVMGKIYTRDCGPLPDGKGGIEVHCGDWKCVDKDYIPPALKPIIYLYPTQKQKTKVTLDYDGDVFVSYPEYNKTKKGWEVIAYPDGKIINLEDNKEYSYLFWEGKPSREINWNLEEGFVVKGTEVREFFQEVLEEIGLTPREYNEFIVYWYPKMKDNKYNLIHFATGTEYSDHARLTTNPKADSVLRVFMVYKSIKEPINLTPQKFEGFSRDGFTVVEWGGSEIK